MVWLSSASPHGARSLIRCAPCHLMRSCISCVEASAGAVALGRSVWLRRLIG